MRKQLVGLLFVVCAAVQAAPIAGQGTWETTLQARDINNDGTVDAYYDTSSNLTWLADANLPATSGYSDGSNVYPPGIPGGMSTPQASLWASNLSLFGVTGWRLPKADNYAPPGCAGPFGIWPGFRCSFVPLPGTSEFGDLFSETLGNDWHTGWSNTGPFSNIVRGSGYAIGTLYTGPELEIERSAAEMAFYDGTLGIAYEEYAHAAWAVHDGDIAPVPEPQSYALLLLGLVVLAGVRTSNIRPGVTECSERSAPPA